MQPANLRKIGPVIKRDPKFGYITVSLFIHLMHTYFLFLLVHGVCNIFVGENVL